VIQNGIRFRLAVTLSDIHRGLQRPFHATSTTIAFWRDCTEMHLSAWQCLSLTPYIRMFGN